MYFSKKRVHHVRGGVLPRTFTSLIRLRNFFLWYRIHKLLTMFKAVTMLREVIEFSFLHPKKWRTSKIHGIRETNIRVNWNYLMYTSDNRAGVQKVDSHNTIVYWIWGIFQYFLWIDDVKLLSTTRNYEKKN